MPGAAALRRERWHIPVLRDADRWSLQEGMYERNGLLRRTRLVHNDLRVVGSLKAVPIQQRTEVHLGSIRKCVTEELGGGTHMGPPPCAHWGGYLWSRLAGTGGRLQRRPCLRYLSLSLYLFVMEEINFLKRMKENRSQRRWHLLCI